MRMTFEEAKRRDDYRFKALLDRYINDLRNSCFEEWSEADKRDGEFNYGVAILEIGNVDIELNVNAMCNDDGTGYANKVDAVYFCCVKGTTGWCEAGYLDDFGYTVVVEWNADDYLEQLERDMFENLMKAVKEFDLKIDEPNFEAGHEFDVFDRIHGIKR